MAQDIAVSPRRYSLGGVQFTAPKLTPGLMLVATPIGNLGDMTLRGLEALAGADALLCEDTRVSGKLLERYGIRVPLIAYHDHNAQKMQVEIIARLKRGEALALISDAGMPLVSDPGFRLVAACVSEGIAVSACPGASAVTTALALSGLATDRFCFLGFLPHRQGERQRLLRDWQNLPATLIAFESPHRLLDALADIAAVLAERPMVVARELTKLHEELARGTAITLHADFAARPAVKGEIVLVIAPPDETAPPTEELIEAAITAALKNAPPAKAAAQVARELGLARDDVYQRILKRRGHAP